MSAGGYLGPEAGREVGRYFRVSLRETAEGAMLGTAPIADHMCGPDGVVRAGALLTMLDMVGGLCGGLASLPDGWVVSTNLAARIAHAKHVVAPLLLEADVLRRGRNNVVTGVRAYDVGGELLVAEGVLTSAILVPEDGPLAWERPVVLEIGDAEEDLPPLTTWLGARAVDRETVAIDLRDELRNPWGILHGGIVATLVDLATEHATDGAIVDVVLHFLAPNRVGPVSARARELGRRPDGRVCRVELRDEGADRVTAVAVVTARVE
jgi:acyl-coenzyme A thioesterase PaaI-like protein